MPDIQWDFDGSNGRDYIMTVMFPAELLRYMRDCVSDAFASGVTNGYKEAAVWAVVLYACSPDKESNGTLCHSTKVFGSGTKEENFHRMIQVRDKISETLGKAEAGIKAQQEQCQPVLPGGGK